MSAVRYRNLLALVALAGTVSGWADSVQAQVKEPEPVYRCDLRSAKEPALSLVDDASHRGALISNVQLITLHNGMKAVSFSATYADRFASNGSPRKLRFTVSWFDDCGRPVSLGSNVFDGVVLNPGQHVTRQSVAPTRDASSAEVRFYVEPSTLMDPYQ